MLKGLTIAGLLLIGITHQAQAQSDTLSTNWAITGCRDLVAEADNNFYRQGHCTGMVLGVSYAAPDICVPAGVTPKQMVAVALQYANQNPQRWHETFAKTAYDGLLKAWPCRR